MTKLFYLEIKKIVFSKLFIIGFIVVLLLIGMSLLIKYNEAYIIDSVKYSGSKRIERDKAFSEIYKGRTVDDKLISDLQNYLLESSIPDEAKKEMPFGTSLKELHSKFFIHDKETGEILGAHGEKYILTADEIWGDIEPPVFYHNENWRVIITAVSGMLQISILLIVAFSSQIFSSEYSSGMIYIIKPTKNGNSNLVRDKLLSAFAISVLIFILTVVICTLSYGILWGFENPNADIRTFSDGSFLSFRYQMTCSQLFFSTIFFCFSATMIITGLCLLISTVTPNPFVSVIISLGLLYLPKLLPLGLIQSEFIKKIVVLMPMNIFSITSMDWTKLGFKLNLYVLIPVIALLAVTFDIAAVYFLFRRRKLL